MARAIWTGSVSFGLVSIPVKLFNATSPKDVRFHQFQRGTGRRVRYQRVVNVPEGPPLDETPPEPHAEPAVEPGPRRAAAPPIARMDPGPPASGGRTDVDFEDVVKGYELEPERFVMVDRRDLESLRPEPTQTIEIEDFVSLTDIDPVFFEKAYYLAPQRGVGAEKPYSLLLQAMRQADRVGIARFVLRTKEYLSAIRPMDDVLALHTMYFADEVRETKEIENLPVEVSVSPKEVGIAQQLIALLAKDWDPGRYRDTYRERVLELIGSRAAGQEIVEEERPERVSRVPDLMEALRRSVEAAKERRSAETG